MSSIITAITVFAFIAALLLWIVIGTRGKLFLKTLLILLILPCSILIWNGFESYQGWPTPKDPPEKFLFLSGIIYPPDKQANYKGEIFIWLIEYKNPLEKQKELSLFQKIQSLFVYHPLHEPRAHKFPYSKGLAEQVGEAMERQKQGIPTIVERGKKGKQGNKEGPPAAEKHPGGWNDTEQEYQFYPLPPPKFPEKMREN